MSKTQVIEFSGGYNLLMLKSEEGDFDEVKKLLGDGKAFDVNSQNKNGYTALALATKGGFFEIVQSLIYVGANVNISNNSGQTPVFLACWHNHEQLVKLLLDSGANINTTDQRGWTPLMIAVYHTHKNVVKILMDRGADITVQDTFGKKAIDRTKDPAIISILEKKPTVEKQGNNNASKSQSSTKKVLDNSRNQSPIRPDNSLISSASKSKTSSAQKNNLESSIGKSNYNVLSPKNLLNSISKESLKTPTSNSRSSYGRIKNDTNKQSIDNTRKTPTQSPQHNLLGNSITSAQKMTTTNATLKSYRATQQSTSGASPGQKRHVFKDEMHLLVNEHMANVSDRLSNLILHKISLEVPSQMQSYEDKLKKEIESVLKFRIDEIFKGLQSFFNLKLKFLLNRLGFEAQDIDLSPFIEDEETSPVKLRFSTVELSRTDPQRLVAMEKDIDNMEKALQSYKLSKSTYEQDPYEFEATSLGYKAETIKNDLIDQLNYDVRSTTEYLIELSNGRITELVRGEAGALQQKLLNELSSNIQAVEEQIKSKFEDIINQKINDLAEKLSGQAPKKSRPESPQRSSTGNNKFNPHKIKLNHELDRIPNEEGETHANYFKSPENRRSVNTMKGNGSGSVSNFPQMRDRINQIKKSLNSTDPFNENRSGTTSNPQEEEDEYQPAFASQKEDVSQHYSQQAEPQYEEEPEAEEVRQEPIKPQQKPDDRNLEKVQSAFEKPKTWAQPQNPLPNTQKISSATKNEYGNKGKQNSSQKGSAQKGSDKKNAANIPSHRFFGSAEALKYDFTGEN